MDRVCAAPECDQRAAATVRHEVAVCADHYWLIRRRLDRLGVGIGEFQRPIADLLVPEQMWTPIAAALASEAELVRTKARGLRQTARDALRQLHEKRRQE
jgi:hypothetical protein